MKFISMLTVTMLAITTLVHADDSYDVRKFDISGLRLGMNPIETMQAIKQRFTNAKIEPSSRHSPLNSDIELINSIHVKNENEDLYIHFSDISLKGEENKPEVRRIDYIFPDTPLNLKNLKQVFLSKYGNPTMKSKYQWEWCISSDNRCDYRKPVLTLYHATHALTLVDDSYNQALLQKILNIKITKPTILQTK